MFQKNVWHIHKNPDTLTCFNVMRWVMSVCICHYTLNYSNIWGEQSHFVSVTF